MSHVPADDVSIGEFGHSGHIPGRPVSWVVVVLVCGGFIAAGFGLTLAQPWLFYVGVAVVALAVIIGTATHAMADVTNRVETQARRRAATENRQDADGSDAHRADAAGAGAGAEHRAEEPARH
jgi:hypothetical protein